MCVVEPYMWNLIEADYNFIVLKVKHFNGPFKAK